jgi:hypothetical protein
MASLDGSRIGTDNTLVVMTELTNYVYASEATMMDNVQYMNILCETAGLDDNQKLVLFLNGLDMAPNVHGEVRATAAQFRRDNKTWEVISAALCDSYNVLFKLLLPLLPTQRSLDLGEAPKPPRPRTTASPTTARSRVTRRPTATSCTPALCVALLLTVPGTTIAP